MAETSGFWTTSGTPSGHQVSGYTQAMHSLALRVASGAKVMDGVAIGYLNELAPSVASNVITIASGGALVDGKYYDNTANVQFTIPASTSGTTRYDRIVVRVTWASFTAVLTRIAGTDSGSPTVPSLTQTRNNTYDIPIAKVLVNSAGALTLTDERNKGDVTQTLPILVLNESESLVASSSIPVKSIIVPERWNNATLTGITAGVFTASSSGLVTVRLYNATTSQNILSTNVTIDANEQTSMTALTPPVINNSYKVLSKGQVLQLFVESAGTGAKGLQVDLIALAVV